MAADAHGRQRVAIPAGVLVNARARNAEQRGYLLSGEQRLREREHGRDVGHAGTLRPRRGGTPGRRGRRHAPRACRKTSTACGGPTGATELDSAERLGVQGLAACADAGAAAQRGVRTSGSRPPTVTVNEDTQSARSGDRPAISAGHRARVSRRPVRFSPRSSGKGSASFMNSGNGGSILDSGGGWRCPPGRAFRRRAVPAGGGAVRYAGARVAAGVVEPDQPQLGRVPRSCVVVEHHDGTRTWPAGSARTGPVRGRGGSGWCVAAAHVR
jgi:hypothetical protein